MPRMRDGPGRFVLFLLAWLVVVGGAVALLGLGSGLMYFTVAYVGFLLAVEYTTPQYGRPTWHRRLRWLSLFGLVVFVFTVAFTVLGWIAPGAVPTLSLA